MSTVYMIENDRFADFAIDAEESVQICNRDGSNEMVTKAAFLFGADVYATLEGKEADSVIADWFLATDKEGSYGLVDDENDGQPTEYEEWQDYYGGDDWDHGQFDEAF